jgi:acyl-CoA synthetase (AMP-forming)/AMP-acid ligase II
VVTPQLLVDALELAAARAEGDVALAHAQRSVTWGELEGLANALAFALERRGVTPGTRVATLLEGIDEAVAFWAIAKAGAVGVPFFAYDVDDLAALLRRVDARALIVDASVAPTFHHAVARTPQLGLVVVRGRQADVDATGSAVYVPYDAALADEDPLSRPPARRIDLDDAWLAPEDDDTSFALSHRVVLSRAASMVRGLGIGPGDIIAGTSLPEVAVAAALSGACLWASDESPRTDKRALWITDDTDEDPPPAGMTPVFLYGSVASGPIAVLAPGNDPSRVLPNVDVRVIDDTGAPAAVKVVGEICVRSSSLATAVAAAAEGGYFRTGDSGMLDDSGALYVL